MSPVEAPPETFLAEFEAQSARLPASTQPRIEALRAEGVRALPGLRLPTIKDESWRFTPLTPLKAHTWRWAGTTPPAVMAGDIGRFLLPETDCCRLVFVDGVHVPSLSTAQGMNTPVKVVPFVACDPSVLEQHLGRSAPIGGDVFGALNALFALDGAAVVIPAGVEVSAPLQLIFVSTGQGALATHPRVLVVVGRGASATLVEEYVSLAEGPLFTNAVTEVVLEAGARLSHTRVQSESRAGIHLGRSVVTLARDAVYESQAIALGARLSRLDLTVVQGAENTESTLSGLALIAGDQEADTHTRLDHAFPHGRSRQLHKTIVGDQAHAVFNGQILVRPGAQLTDSSQQSRNLLLSDRARVDAKPELEIFADDVKCAHGATVGQIDAEELFYLKSRGMSEEIARDLLTYAFAAEVIDQVPVPSLRRQLQTVVMRRTDHHQALR